MYLCCVSNVYENMSREELVTQNQQLQFSIAQLRAELNQIKRLIYGSKSERFVPSNPNSQISLDLDVESPSVIAPPAITTVSYQKKKEATTPVLHPGRRPFPSHLPRVEIVIEPLESIAGLKAIGKEITEQLEFEPGRLFVKQYVRVKYAKANDEGIIIGNLPSMPIEKGIPGPGLLANIFIEKYIDHLPLYRQIERYKREGVDITSSSISDWVSAGCNWIRPVFDCLQTKILNCDYLQVDETPIKVLDRSKKGESHRGYYWVYRDPVNKLVLFDYRKGRGREGPQELLENFKGYLQTDGYSAYDAFDGKEIKLMHCMAHARRYFDQALENDKVRAEYVLHEIQKLYAIERKAKENMLTHKERLTIRQELSVPILSQMHQWLKTNITQVPPQSLIGKALAYSLSRWEKLMLYCKDGRLEIDNNLVENAIRPVAIGRKNYLFAGSHDAAQRAAMIYSMLGTCKMRGVEPFSWLKNFFEVIPQYKANKLEELLP